jgi:hypothetical protein
MWKCVDPAVTPACPHLAIYQLPHTPFDHTLWKKGKSMYNTTSPVNPMNHICRGFTCRRPTTWTDRQFASWHMVQPAGRGVPCATALEPFRRHDTRPSPGLSSRGDNDAQEWQLWNPRRQQPMTGDWSRSRSSSILLLTNHMPLLILVIEGSLKTELTIACAERMAWLLLGLQ